MKTTRILIGALIATAAMAVAAQANAASNRSYQAYAIVDFKTDAPKAMLADTVEKSITGYASDLQTNRPIGVPMPETPGRFVITNPLEGSPLAGMMAMAGNAAQFQTASCPGAVWTANFTRKISGVQSMRSVLCIYQYKTKDGEQHAQLQMYVNDVAERGGSILERAGRAAATKMVGTPEEFTAKMLKDAVSSIEVATGAGAFLVEGEPEIPGLAWRR